MTIKNGETADAYEVIGSIGRLAAQNAYQCLQANDVFVNRDNLGADEFTDADGTNGTVDTGNSTAYYYSTDDDYILNYTDSISGESTHDPDSFNNPANAFDGSDSTYADKSSSASIGTFEWNIGKTFSSTYIGMCFVKVAFDQDGPVGTKAVHIQTYDGATWTTQHTITDTELGGTLVPVSKYFAIDDTIQGIRAQFDGYDNGANSKVARLYLLEAGDYDASNTVETNEIIDCTSAPKSLVVYGHADLPTDTSITVDVSDDGGTTFGVTGGSLNEAIDTTTLSGSSIALKFNLATTDTSKTPSLFGYAICITDK